MEGANFTTALNMCARKCATLRFTEKCNNAFGDVTCTACEWYILNYNDASPAHNKLFMLQAEEQVRAEAEQTYNRVIAENSKLLAMQQKQNDTLAFKRWAKQQDIAERQRMLQDKKEAMYYDAVRMRKNAGNGSGFLTILGIGLLILIIWIVSVSVKQNISVNRRLYGGKPQTTTTPVLTPTHNQHQNILNTLNRVDVDLRNYKDVNEDGKINCIDAAVLFYKYFPDKSKVCIESNLNTDKNFHHLFNCVLIDGQWRAIEPQAKYGSFKSYYMGDVWGNTYDRTRNKDLTAEYIKYVK